MINLILLASRLKTKFKYKDNALYYNYIYIKVHNNKYNIYFYDKLLFSSDCIETTLVFLNERGLK